MANIVDSTPISELPGTLQQYQQQQQQQPQYNPQQHHQPQQQQQIQRPYLSPNQMQMQLPSRDIPQNTAMYMHDEEIKANYIPESNDKSNFIYNEEEESNRSFYDRKKKRDALSELFSYQDSIFLVILYVIFQLPFLDNFIKLNFSSLGMYEMDGNMTIRCHIAKGCIMAAIYRFSMGFLSAQSFEFLNI
jgi:hypothetical protein